MNEIARDAAPRSDGHGGLRLALLCLVAVGVISVLDGFTTGGIVVGILLSIPIIAVSSTDRPLWVWLVFCAAWAGFLVAATYGLRPSSVSAIALPNRVFVMLTIGASAGVALTLQRRRIEAQRARDVAIDTREINRLLMSLIAHDLRAPLATSLHAFRYLEHIGALEDEADLVHEIQGRLQRSLRVIDAFLSIGKSDDAKPGEVAAQYITGRQLATILTDEIRAFVPEAEARAKSLDMDFSGLADGNFHVNVLILRQTMAILLDNAVRYAVPGPIRLAVETSDEDIALTVEDSGPGLSAQKNGRGGTGLGLELCHALVKRARGRLDVVRDRPDGTAFVLRLPLQDADVAAPG